MTDPLALTMEERERLSNILDRINQAVSTKAKAIQEQEEAETEMWEFAQELKAGRA